MITTSWSIALPELLRVLAYTTAGVALFRLFRRRETAILGRRRWLLVVAVASLSALQIVSFIAWINGDAGLAQGFALGAACAMLVTAVTLWPYLALIRASLFAARDEAVEKRLSAAEARAVEAKSWLLLAEEIAHVGHWRISHPDNALFWSDEIFRIHGLAPSREMPNVETAVDFFHPDDRVQIRHLVEQALQTGTPYEFEARLVRRDGEIRHVLSRAKVEISEDGRVTALFGVFVDITVRKLMEDRLLAEHAKVEQHNKSLLELAMRDSLTGLPNRRQFDHALRTEIKRSLRGGPGFGLVMIDIDCFKQYNDVYGHLAGDECLRRVAEAIAAAPQRPSDMVARYGGEEFVVLLPGVDEAGAATVAGRAIDAVRAMNITHQSGRRGRVTVSCGVAWFDPATGGDAPEDVVDRADRALYVAKHAGRDRLVMAAPAMPETPEQVAAR